METQGWLNIVPFSFVTIYSAEEEREIENAFKKFITDNRWYEVFSDTFITVIRYNTIRRLIF